MKIIKILSTLIFVCSTTTSIPLEKNPEMEILFASAATPICAPNADLPEDFAELIAYYESPDFLAYIDELVKEYTNPDFLYSVTHPREAQLARLSAWNKKPLLTFPAYHNQAPLGICVCDLIQFGSATTLHYIGKNIFNTMAQDLGGKIAAELTKALASSLSISLSPEGKPEEEKLTEESFSKIAATATSYKNAKKIYVSFIKKRLLGAVLRHVTKQLAPPLFLMHQPPADFAGPSHNPVTPISTVIPLDAMNGLLDNLMATHFITNHAHANPDRIANRYPEIFVNIMSDYTLEGAKQLELIGTIDETLLFTIVKECIFSAYFLYFVVPRETKNFTRKIFTTHHTTIHALLKAQQAAATETSSRGEKPHKSKPKNLLENFVTKSLQSEMNAAWEPMLNKYYALFNLSTTGLLLIPGIVHIISKIRSFITAFKKIHPANPPTPQGNDS